VRTENSIRGFSSILLAFAIVLSTAISVTFTATPVIADAVNDWPGRPGGVIPGIYNVVQGQTFLLRHRMTWDEPGVPGYYLVAIYWDYYNLANNAVGDNGRHFTIVSATAYIDNNYDNVPDLVLAAPTVSTGDNGTRYTIGVSNAVGDDNEGTFNVDIVLRAAGPDGTPHAVTDNHPIYYTIMQSLESVPPSAAVPLVTVRVLQWTSGVLVRGKANAYNIDQAGLLPYVWYTAGDEPPIVVAQRVDAGAFVAGGISSTCRNLRWDDNSPKNTNPYLDNLLNAAFKWMRPGPLDNRDNVLWYENSIYNKMSGGGSCTRLRSALINWGYDVDNTSENLTPALLANYDILVIAQFQFPTFPGENGLAGGNPNDPRLGPWIETINNWVRGGGGLLLMDGSDFAGHNYCRVHNKILDALDSPWWFQHDQVADDVDKWGANYEMTAVVDTTTPIGLAYQTISGTDNLGVYSVCSMLEVPTFSVSVSVIPSTLQSGPEDSDFTWTATVTNNGANDNFLLSVSDSASPDWDNLSISPVNITIQGGNSYDATVKVSIPIGTPYCTYDTLTVTATSFTDSGVSASDTGQAHSTGAALLLRGVTVEIEPEHQEAVMIIDPDAIKKRYDPLTFKVIVTNTGYLDDKYIITATTPSDKMLELWPTELFLQPGKSDFVVLSVTVPEDEVGSNLNYITVEAVGTFATGTGDDLDNAAAFDMCTVHVQEAYCVRIDVWPFQTQTGTPGSKIRWIARVKNLGNTTNIYTISASALVYDFNRVYGPIPVTLTPDYVVIPPCNWAQVIIDIEIPLGLETSTMIDVLVEVQSLIEPQCYDYAEVDVHVVRSIPKIPQGVIKLEVETEIIAIQVWPDYWDFGVLDEAEPASTPADYFTVRNIGNEPVNVFIRGNDAYSAPGELTTTWMLDDLGNIGLDRYVLKWNSVNTLTHADQLLFGNLVVSEERTFDLTLTAPSSITVPSRMWTLVNLTALEA